MNVSHFPTSVHDSLLTICLFAAFADGEQSDTEREAVRQIADDLGSEQIASLSRQILMRKLPLETVVAGLPDRESRLLAYEMALGICEAEGSVSPEEQEFLDSLRSLLDLGKADSQAVEDRVVAITHPPVETSAPSVPAATDPQNSDMILRYAILNGALELLPETLATMTIIPLQMKMVYRIGKSHGVELDRTHLKEFLATAGVGFGSQVLEGFARKLIGGFGKKLMGGTGGKAASQLTGSAFSFASTYAIGHVAEKYYADGRRLNHQGIQELFTSLQTQARELHAKYLPQIQERAQTLNPTEILSLVTDSKRV